MTHARLIGSVLAPAAACGLCLLAVGIDRGADQTQAKAAAMSFCTLQHRAGEGLAMKCCQKTYWQLNYKKAEGKPYFHPVCLPDGRPLTWLRPADHKWHRAIWFSWKHINGLNYWEENKQGLSQGRTEVVDLKHKRGKDGATHITMDLTHYPPGKPPVLTERRSITVTMPDSDKCYRMDWQSVFTAGEKEVLLDRTKTKPEGGPAWGGYAGLSYRAAEAMRKYQVLDSEGRRDMKCHGQHAKWMDFSGVIDAKTNEAAGVAMFDHPTNPRSPSPWYVAMSGKFGYFGPAFLFDKPCRLAAGKTLKLSYRILIHPQRGTKEQLDKEYRDFIGRK